jgi:ketosteroid isomerase-like protein
MSTEQNLDTFDRWLAAHQRHDLDGLLDCVNDTITIQSAAGANMPPAEGKTQARHHWQTIYNTFPDMRMEKVGVVADEDTIFAEISHGGTMSGPMGPHQPTGKAYRVDGAFRIDFVAGRIESILSYWDTAAMLRQLSLIA